MALANSISNKMLWLCSAMLCYGVMLVSATTAVTTDDFAIMIPSVAPSVRRGTLLLHPHRHTTCWSCRCSPSSPLYAAVDARLHSGDGFCLNVAHEAGLRVRHSIWSTSAPASEFLSPVERNDIRPGVGVPLPGGEEPGLMLTRLAPRRRGTTYSLTLRRRGYLCSPA